MLKPLTVWTTKNCRKFLKEMRIPDYLTFLLRNLYADQKTTVKTGPEGWRSQDGGGIGRGDHFLSYKFIERTIEH